MGTFPAVAREGLRGGAEWQEGTVVNPPRLIMEGLRWAEACGAVVKNYSAAVALKEADGTVSGAVIREGESGDQVEVHCSRLALCLGAADDHQVIPGVPRLAPSADLFLSFNLIIHRPLGSASAVAVSPEKGRGHLYFLVPLGSKTLAGTHHESFLPGSPLLPEESRVDEMVTDLQSAIPAWGLERGDVSMTLQGVVPEKARGDQVQDLSKCGGPRGLFRVRSAKYTTAPTTAGRLLRSMFGKGLPMPGDPPRPDPRRALTVQEFLDLHVTDASAAKEWVQGFYSSENPRCVDDFVLRRMDWGLNPVKAAEAAGVIQGLVEPR